MAGGVVSEQIVVETGIASGCHYKCTHIGGQMQGLINEPDSFVRFCQRSPTHVDDVRPR